MNGMCRQHVSWCQQRQGVYLWREGINVATGVQGCSCQHGISWVVAQLGKSPETIGQGCCIKVLHHIAVLAKHGPILHSVMSFFQDRVDSIAGAGCMQND